MDPKELAAEEAKIAADIKKQQELLDAFKKVRSHLEATKAESPKNVAEEPLPTVAVRKRTREKVNGSEATNEPVSKAGSVRDAVKELVDKFTVIDVHENLIAKGIEIEKKEISFVLSRFLRNEEIFQLEAGVGRRPSVYTTIPPSESDLEGSSTDRASTTASHGS